MTINKNNIFNIEANYHFFESFFQFLEEKFPQNIGDLQIILPNRRSCRELKELFLLKGFNGEIPQIKAISDISYEDFFQFLPQESAKIAIDELTDIKIFDDLSYLFFLTEKIQKQTIFGELNFEQSFKVAIALKELFDAIERDEIDLIKLIEIDDSNLARHRQITLEFLGEFSIHIKNLLLKENILSPSSYQNLLVNKFTDCLQTQQLKSPLIIAGSTGSVGFSKKLIKKISQQDNGFVILQNFQQQAEPKENHPQFLLNRLVKFCEQKPKNINQENCKLSPDFRQEFLSLMMLPFEEVIKWQNIKSENITEDLEKNFLLIEAKNNIEEAKITAQILQKNHSKKSAVIINNNDFANILKLELQRLNLEFNDSRSKEITTSKLINFFILITEVIERDFNSHSLLALFKNQFCNIERKIINELEIKILRKSRSEIGLKGLKKALKNHPDLERFFNDFLSKIPDNLNGSSLIKIAEKLTNKTWQNLIAEEEAGEEIFALFEHLNRQNHQIKTVNDLKVILSQVSYFSKTDAISKIQILSPIEARLLNFDLIIITSLNEGSFPQISSENWLGKKIKKDLGIDKALQKIGQNAHDFCNYLSNKKVVLTRPQSKNGAALIESPFLIKFKTIAQKLGAVINNGEEFFQILADENKISELAINRANPQPALNLRPQQFSITEISKLISNPYFIYCKKILRLRQLDKIDYEAGHAEFGSFVHEALEEFIRDPKKVNFEKIFDQYFSAKEAKLTWWPKFENIFANFLEQNAQFLDFDSLLEEEVEARIGNILLRGKIDRIILGDEAEIFDYKSGTIPEAKKVFSGLEPQLTISALILIENKLKSYDISGLNYWKLSSGEIGKITKTSKNKEEIEILIAAAKEGLEKLFSYFEDEKSGYLATSNLTYDEYQHLARVND